MGLRPSVLSDTAGCISTFIQKGNLDLWHTAIPGLCYWDLTLVMADLSGEAYDYFLRLETLTGLILKAVSDRAKAG